MSSCGRNHYERFKDTKQLFKGVLAVKSDLIKQHEVVDVELYSSYLGKVPIRAKVIEDNVYLDSLYITNKHRTVYIKVLDLNENKLSENYVYYPQQLLHLHSVCINKKENLYNYILTLYCYLRINQLEFHDNNILKYKNLINDVITSEITEKIQKEYPQLLNETVSMPLSRIKKILQQVLLYNSRVDILFGVLEYLQFISTVTNGKLDTINDQDILVCISGVPKLDNAYWNGQYMVFGNGDYMFYPLTSIDVIGHELSHGLVQGICDLEYKGHSGALNESYADILGTMLEYYVHEKYQSKILGKSNWLIGEDLSMTGNCLRNMSDPNLTEQPKKMYDKFYVNPCSMIDYGGVHINSGIPNYCFYLISQNISNYQSLKIFIKCLYLLKKKSNFINFSVTLNNITINNTDESNEVIKKALFEVGLSTQYNHFKPMQYNKYNNFIDNFISLDNE